MNDPDESRPPAAGDRPTGKRRSVDRSPGTTAGLLRDSRADVPMRIAPLLLVGLILVVLAILGGALL